MTDLNRIEFIFTATTSYACFIIVIIIIMGVLLLFLLKLYRKGENQSGRDLQTQESRLKTQER